MQGHGSSQLADRLVNETRAMLMKILTCNDAVVVSIVVTTDLVVKSAAE